MPYFLMLMLLLAPAGRAETRAMAIGLEPVFGGKSFDDPLYLTHAGDGSGRLFVVEQGGQIFSLAGPKAKARTVFLDLRDQVRSRGEMGLLGLAFHPRFRQNGFFYVYYSARRSGRRRISHEVVVSRFKAPGDRSAADAESERVVLKIAQPYSNHNGGCLMFGPDGYLYIGVGDGGSFGDPEGNGQNLGTLLGAMLRIDVDGGDDLAYAIPPGNPFVKRKGARPEIWAYGLRNPWRFSFDRETGELWAADVGQNEIEEINIIEQGGNYGWDFYEGTQRYSDGEIPLPKSRLKWPVAEYRQGAAGRSVTGGYVYRGKAFPELNGMYLYGDYVSGRLRGLRRFGKRVRDGELLATGKAISSFGEDEAGELYLVDYGGQVFRVVVER